MRTLLIIFFAIVCTWFISTQLSIDWPRIIILPPEEKTPPVEPILEPKQSPEAESERPLLEYIEFTTEELEQQIFDLINDKRLEVEKPTLSWGKYKHEKAQAHSEYMASSGNFKHSNRNYFENIYWGVGISNYRIPQSVIDTWMRSPEHKENLLRSEINTGAVGIAFNEKTNSVYATFVAD